MSKSRTHADTNVAYHYHYDPAFVSPHRVLMSKSSLKMATTTSFDLDTYLNSKKALVEIALDESLSAR